MSKDTPSNLIKEIERELEFMTKIPGEHCMYKVHEQLHDVNEKAYKPVLLAIGPYNDQDKVGQGFMKEHKFRYLQKMIERAKGSTVEKYFMALERLKEEARKYYLECNLQTSDEFVKMMLLDGCFIIELFRKYKIYEENEEALCFAGDPIFKMKWVLPRIARDLLLFENQLPFFILAELFEMSEGSGSRNSGEIVIDVPKKVGINVGSSSSTGPIIRTRLTKLALKFFSHYLPFRWNVDVKNYNSKHQIENLLCLTHKALTIPLLDITTQRLQLGFSFENAKFKHLLDLIHASISISILDTEINNAIELHEVEEKAEKFKHLFCLISKAVSQLLSKVKNMRNQEPMGNQEPLLQGGGEGDFEDWERESIPKFKSQLQKARVELKIAKEFGDDVNEIERWKKESIRYDSELQEAGIDFEKAKKFKVLYDPHRNEDKKSIPYRELLHKAGVETKRATKFMELHDLSEIEGSNLLHGAMGLEEAGIKLKINAEKCNSFSIMFNNGTMELSPLRIEDHTEAFLRNLIAYEQYCDQHNGFNYVYNYVHFMDNLINSPKDAEILRRRGIILNYMGDDEIVSSMVNKLGHNINFSSRTYIYGRISREVNMYCRKRRNRWIAKLRRDYFNTPWAWISFLAAVLLLVLTIVQTIFAII